MKTAIQNLVIAFVFISLTTCSKKSDDPAPILGDTLKNRLFDAAQFNGSLVFQSNFEGPCKIIPHTGTNDRIVGKDAILTTKNDWDVLGTDVLSSKGYFNYGGGDSTKRFARLLREPGKNNTVLQYRVYEPWDQQGSIKARVQYEFYGIKSGLKEYYQSVRVFLHEDINELCTYPKTISWFTIVEIWNNITWSSSVPYGFRISLGLGKVVAGEGNLCFTVGAQNCILNADLSQKYTNIWSAKATNVTVPVGKWFTMDYYLKEGNDKTGRFYMTIQPDGDQKQLVFDITNYTHNTGDPNPDGVKHFNPMKLYTSKELADYMNSKGKYLEVYWDDFKIWRK